MGKKHKKSGQGGSTFSPAVSHSAEYRIIKHDLIKVVLLNAIYLVGVLAIYYSNSRSGYLEKWFNRVLHF